MALDAVESGSHREREGSSNEGKILRVLEECRRYEIVAPVINREQNDRPAPGANRRRRCVDFRKGRETGARGGQVLKGAYGVPERPFGEWLGDCDGNAKRQQGVKWVNRPYGAQRKCLRSGRKAEP